MALVDLSRDSLLDGRICLLQPKEGYRSAIDPVFLAAAVPAGGGEQVLDLGCGVGTAALCLLWRVGGAQAVGLENQASLVDLAAQNAELNGLAGRFSALAGDVARPPAALSPGKFDHVMANPPYLPPARARATAPGLKRAAMVEGEAGIADWVALGLELLKPKGSLTLVHRADRLDALMAALYGCAGGIRVFPLWPGGPEKPAKRVIVQARKAVASPTRLSSGLILHRPDGSFTAAAQSVLREAQALDLD